MRWSLGAEGRVPRRAQRRVMVFFWPTRALILRPSKDVGEPDLYRLADGLTDRCQTGGEVFLKMAAASGSWAWWRGRAESLR